MTEKIVVDKRKPFHEALVDLIKNSKGKLTTLHRLVHVVEIPGNHDEILKAIDELASSSFICLRSQRQKLNRMREAILVQKMEAEAKRAS